MLIVETKNRSRQKGVDFQSGLAKSFNAPIKAQTSVVESSKIIPEDMRKRKELINIVSACYKAQGVQDQLSGLTDKEWSFKTISPQQEFLRGIEMKKFLQDLRLADHERTFE